MSPGRILYHAWHRPRAFWERCRQRGGLHETWLEHQGETAMRRQALNLRPIEPEPGAPLRTLWFLTGRRFWHLTLFCAWSLRKSSGSRLHLHLIDDGSLRPEHTAPFAPHFEKITVISHEEASNRLHQRLPADRFPFIHQQWLTYPNIRKLIDPHLAEPRWNLVIDSDMLFFRRPAALLDWLDRPDRPLHAVDSETSYGYPAPLLDELAGTPVPPLVNVGLTGMDGSKIDWEFIESLCRRLITTHGTHYFLEQAAIAILMARAPARMVLPAEDYITLPLPPEAKDCRAVMHHYVALSKRWYFRNNWQKIAADDPDA
jgi:hypothetical protein